MRIDIAVRYSTGYMSLYANEYLHRNVSDETVLALERPIRREFNREI